MRKRITFENIREVTDRPGVIKLILRLLALEIPIYDTDEATADFIGQFVAQSKTGFILRPKNDEIRT